MKKLWLVPVGIVLLIVIGLVAIPVVNNVRAHRVEQGLVDRPLPAQTECVETLSEVGRFWGNGNGVQYFGAMLLKSELSLEQVQAHYQDGTTCAVAAQTGQAVTVAEHGGLRFSSEVSGEGYYIVYAWEDNRSPLLGLDIRGH